MLQQDKEKLFAAIADAARAASMPAPAREAHRYRLALLVENMFEQLDDAGDIVCGITSASFTYDTAKPNTVAYRVESYGSTDRELPLSPSQVKRALAIASVPHSSIDVAYMALAQEYAITIVTEIGFDGGSASDDDENSETDAPNEIEAGILEDAPMPADMKKQANNGKLTNCEKLKLGLKKAPTVASAQVRARRVRSTRGSRTRTSRPRPVIRKKAVSRAATDTSKGVRDSLLGAVWSMFGWNNRADEEKYTSAEAKQIVDSYDDEPGLFTVVSR